MIRKIKHTKQVLKKKTSRELRRAMEKEEKHGIKSKCGTSAGKDHI